MSFSHTHVIPLESRWFQSLEEKSGSSGMREKPELGESGKSCLHSPPAFKQTDELFPFSQFSASGEPYKNTNEIQRSYFWYCSSSRTPKALGFQRAWSQPKAPKGILKFYFKHWFAKPKTRKGCHLIIKQWNTSIESL